MVRLLLVANKTLASGEVSDFVRDRIAKDDNCQFTLLVPASPHERQPGARMANEIATAGSGARASDASVGEDDWEYARGRLEYGLGILRRLGATVDGEDCGTVRSRTVRPGLVHIEHPVDVDGRIVAQALRDVVRLLAAAGAEGERDEEREPQQARPSCPDHRSWTLQWISRGGLRDCLMACALLAASRQVLCREKYGPPPMASSTADSVDSGSGAA